MTESDPNWPTDGGDAGGDAAGDGGATPPPPPPTPATPPPPPAPSGGPTPGAPGTGTSADVGVRLGARIIDAVILWVVSLVIIVPLFVGMIFADAGGFSMMGGGGSFVANLFSGIIIVAINLGYFVFMDTRFGWTLGKKLLNLEVKGAAGGLPTVEESLKRNAWLALSIVPVLGVLAQLAAAIYIAVTISNSPTNDGWHDEFAGGTTVVRTA